MAKYNVGDKVKVRENISKITGARGVEPMIAFAGKEVTIAKVTAIPGLPMDTYEIKEDTSPFKYAWSNNMFEDIAPVEQTEKTEQTEQTEQTEKVEKKPMPKLTTGMFGKESDGDLFVVVGDNIVYKNGMQEVVSDMENPDYYGHRKIVALYEAVCFNQIEDGKAKVIWEREATDDSEDDEFEEYIDFLKALSKIIDSVIEDDGDDE